MLLTGRDPTETADFFLVFDSSENVYRTTTSAYEPWDDAHYANYKITASLSGAPGRFKATLPAAALSGLSKYELLIDNGDVDLDTVTWNGTAADLEIEGGTTVGGTVGGATITIGSCVSLLRIYGRNVGETDDDDSIYDLTDKHVAIQGMLGDFARRTHCIHTVSSFTITDSDDDITLASITGFHTSRFEKAWIDVQDAPLQSIDIDEITSLLKNDTAKGLPTRIAFDATTGTGKIYPTPNATYTGKVQWWSSLTGWAAGDTGVANTVLNMEADIVRTVMKKGTVYWLQSNSPEHEELAALSFKDYEAYVMQMKGAGTLGQRFHQREISRLSR